MKLSVKILTLVFVLALIASCAKEEILPANDGNSFSKKGSSEVIDISTDGDEDDVEEGDDDILNGDGNGDITDPENDLDFD